MFSFLEACVVRCAGGNFDADGQAVDESIDELLLALLGKESDDVVCARGARGGVRATTAHQCRSDK
jgi:hypothetical protein